MPEEKVVLNCGHEKDGKVGYVMLGSIGKTICKPCNDLQKRKNYSPRVIRRERRPLKVGFTTLVGSIPMPGEDKDFFPKSNGNCCDILNMCTENVDEALKRWPGLAEDCEVEVVEWQGRERIRVVDDRLPPEWKRHNCEGCGIYEIF